MRCGSNEDLQCAHVKARSLHPRLSLKLSNLGILCKSCNLWQGIRTIDYRGIRGLFTRSIRKMKHFGIGIIIGALGHYYMQDMTLSIVISDIQYYLSELNAWLMVGG